MEEFEMLLAEVAVVSEEARDKLVRMFERGEIVNLCPYLSGCFIWPFYEEGHVYWKEIADIIPHGWF